MKNYEYRTELTAEEQSDPILTAAYQVAKARYVDKHGALKMRGKLDDVLYLTHPLMVVDILRKMGVQDSAVLAAAILHDVLEDNHDYLGPKNDPTDNYHAMYNDLLAALNEQVALGHLTQERAEQAADEMFTLTKEVTKPKIYPEGRKIMAQIDHMKEASLEGKFLKIADQAASLFCRLHAPDDPKEFPKEKQIEFTEKATNLVQAIIASARDDHEQETLSRWDSLFGWTLVWARQLDKCVVRADENKIRKNVDFESFFAAEAFRNKTSVVVEHPQVSHSWEPQAAQGQKLPIVRRVDFDCAGNVISCVLMRGTGVGHPLQAIHDRWIDEIKRVDSMDPRTKGKGTTVEVCGLEQISATKTDDGRLFKFFPNMRAEAFAAACEGAGLCTVYHKMAITKEAYNQGAAPSGPKEAWREKLMSHPSPRGMNTDHYGIAEMVDVPLSQDKPYSGMTKVFLGEDGKIIGYRLRADPAHGAEKMQRMQKEFCEALSIQSPDYWSDPKGYTQPRTYMAVDPQTKQLKAYTEPREPKRKHIAIRQRPLDAAAGEQDFYFGSHPSIALELFTTQARRAGILDRDRPAIPRFDPNAENQPMTRAEIAALSTKPSPHPQSDMISRCAARRENAWHDRPQEKSIKLPWR